VSLIHWVGLGAGTPKDRDEVNNRYVCGCDGWVWELDVMDSPSRLRWPRKASAFVSTSPYFDLTWFRNAARRNLKYVDPKFDCADWTSEAAKKRSVSRWVCKNKSLIKSLCKRPFVPAIAGFVYLQENKEGQRDLGLFIINRIRCIQKIIKIWKCTLTLFRVWPRKLSFSRTGQHYISAIAGIWTKLLFNLYIQKMWVLGRWHFPGCDLENYLFRDPTSNYFPLVLGRKLLKTSFSSE
jgi:hypothetical protein